MPSHRRQDENGEAFHERVTDNDGWARLDAWAARYKLAWGFWLVLLGIGGWIGSRVVQPLEAIPVLVEQKDSVVGRLTKLETNQEGMQDILRILSRIACLQLDRADRAKLDLDCRDIPLP